MIKKDLLWKSIIKDLFPNFIKYFFKKYEAQVDWSKGFEFLDNPDSYREKKFIPNQLKNIEEPICLQKYF